MIKEELSILQGDQDMQMDIKEESNLSMMKQLAAKQQNRNAFNIMKEEGLAIVTGPQTSKDVQIESHSTSYEEFKKLMLACILGKRLSKNEIIMMNLIQNISALNRAVKQDQIPLKKALLILEGL